MNPNKLNRIGRGLNTHIALALILAGTLLTGCPMGGGKAKSRSSYAGNGSANGGTSSTQGSSTLSANGTLKIAQLSVVQDTSGNALRVQFDVSGGKSFTQFCGSNGTCVCRLRWQDINSTSGSATIAQPRFVESAVNVAQTGMAQCPLPRAYTEDVETGTAVTVSVVSLAGSSFTSSEMILRKGGSAVSGETFTDDKGTAFWDIVRYACFDRFRRQMNITNRFRKLYDSNSQGYTWVPLSNNFCVPKMDGSNDPDGCRLGNPEDSNQSTYFSLYSRATQISPTLSNLNFFCANVMPPLSARNDDLFPLDKGFALAAQRSADYPIGVEANGRLNGGSGDPSSYSTGCTQDTSATDNAGGNTSAPSSPGSSGIIKGCIGFAAKPGKDGSCPLIQRREPGSGILVPQQTYRLRRYYAVYPALFEADGKPLNKGQSVDTVYILDRPALYQGKISGSVLGPKPCPFAYIDSRNVTGKGSNQPVATNDPAWLGKNTDGIQVPFLDSDSTTHYSQRTVNAPANYEASCAAIAPVLTADRNAMWLLPISSSNPYYIRPAKPWAPHYEEDTSFQACAPVALNAQDPPIHMIDATNTPNKDVRYCAEIYPTSVQVQAYGLNANTTHAGGTARAVSGASAGAHWKIPLLAPAADTENALRADPAYSCTVTSDTRVGVNPITGRATPGSCCAATGTHFEPAGCAAPSL